MADTDWTELILDIPGANDTSREVAIAILADIGFESFTYSETGIKAYISTEEFSEEAIIGIGLSEIPALKGVSWSNRIIERINWNLEWEKNFEPVIIAGRCSVRAPFHAQPEGVDFDIIIEPKMSFGTGHHQTTALMTTLLLDAEVKGKEMLDMGCGTGILAILAFMKGAVRVVAVDIDEWACLNTRENAAANDAVINVRKGDVGSVRGEKYNLVAANITRNILIENMKTLSDCLLSDGQLFLSGFYLDDLPEIKKTATASGLTFTSHLTKEGWCAAAFRKH